MGLLGAMLASTTSHAQRSRFADPPPQDPILRIEPDMHTSGIRRIGVDRACRILATGSHDKTVRLWAIPPSASKSGSTARFKLLRTLRPPIGEGDNGKIYATAITPDGRLVAAGGWNRTGGDHWVYIFEASTGRALGRLGRLANVVNHLTFSNDGRYLAVTIGGGEGMRVWDTKTWKLAGSDKSYDGQRSLGAGFDARGNLYTVAYDGNIRRYGGSDFKLEAKGKTLGGKEPFSISVREAGAGKVELAVGFDDTTGVDIYDGQSLERLVAADLAGVKNGDVSSVSWSGDGTVLYGGGRYDIGGPNPIRIWDQNGRGKGRNLKVGSDDTIMHILPCADRIAFASADPSFGVMEKSGANLHFQPSVVADLRAIPRRYREWISVSADGGQVRFPIDHIDRDSLVFDVASEQLLAAPTRPLGLDEPITTGLPVTDWLNQYKPKHDGKVIALDNYERARALAIAPDNSRFVLGTEWSFRAYDAKGKELWKRDTTGPAWVANITRNGKIVVIAMGDGTIRWHRLSDGAELLALFVHRVDRRWVAWTPKGYYMASPGAESLIGWHVNHAWNQKTDFFTADRFRDQFNRPDIVRTVLAALDEEKAITEANKRANVARGTEDIRAIAPPTVIIQRPSDNGTFANQEVTLEYFVVSPTGKRITDIDVRVNNSALAARAPIPLKPRGNDEPIRMTLTLPPEDVTITLVAREGDRASEPASVRLRWDGAKPGAARLPRLHALFVGVNAYTSPGLKPLAFAAKDATDLAKFFNSQKGKSYRDIDVKVLPDAKRSSVLEGLEWLEKGSQEGDVNLLFLAGHGLTDEKGHFYFMAADSDPERARATGVSRDEIVRTIRNLKGARVVMLDACHSGASVDGSVAAASRVDMNRLANELGDKSLGVFLYASALGRQSSYEHPDWKNGAFTHAMIKGLSGGADREKLGYVETDELAVYVRRQVLTMTKRRQEPVRIKPDAAAELRLVRFE